VAADLHIHALGELSEDDVCCFFGHMFGSKHFRWHAADRCIDGVTKSWRCPHQERVTRSDSVWVGRVSWLKAALFSDDRYIPEAVQQVHDIIGEDLPLLDEQLLEQILEAAEIPNTRASWYDTVMDRGDPEIVVWLRDHMNQRLFTVSW
jgi:hypothetical protein